MDRDSLIQRLHGFEWDDVEFKAAANAVPEDSYETVSAFANTSGGWLVFGISENKGVYTVTGVTNPDGLQGDFLTTCRSTEKFSRRLEVKPKQYDIEGRCVLAFYIPAVSRFDKPVKVRIKKQWLTFVRIGSGDHQCSVEEENRFLRDASLESFDTTSCEGASIDDLDQKSIEWFRGVIAHRNPERAYPDLDLPGYLSEMGLLRGKGQVTHAAVLMFGKEVLLSRVKPGGLVDFRLVHGPWSYEVPDQRWDDREFCDGNLVKTIRALFERLIRLCPNPFSLEANQLQRSAESPDYLAVREALVNLLVHQDYSDKSRTSTILWFDDRAIFSNPGDSFATLEDMLDGCTSQLRNPLLVRLFRLAGFADQAGTGVSKIIKAWRDAKRVPPSLNNQPAQKRFGLTLFWSRLETPKDQTWFKSIGLSVSEDEGRLLSFARDHDYINLSTARLVTGLNVPATMKLLAHLTINNLLEPVGDGGLEAYQLANHLQTLWEKAEPVSERVNEPVSERVKPAEQARSEFLYGIIVRNKGARVPLLVELSGWSEAMVKRVLAELKQQGKIEFKGAPKTGGYVPLP